MTAGLTVLLVWLWQPIPATVWQMSNPVGVGFVWAAYLGVWGLMFSATFPIGHFRFFGLAQAWERVRGTPAPQASFTLRWLYGIMRHPISLGWMLVQWLTPHMTLGIRLNYLSARSNSSSSAWSPCRIQHISRTSFTVRLCCNAARGAT